jgi:hypothetical protein
MFAAERNPKALTVNALPGSVFSHVEDYTPLAVIIFVSFHSFMAS